MKFRMEQDELRWLASLSPEQHLRHTLDLIKRVYADKLAQQHKDHKKIQ